MAIAIQKTCRRRLHFGQDFLTPAERLVDNNSRVGRTLFSAEIFATLRFASSNSTPNRRITIQKMRSRGVLYKKSPRRAEKTAGSTPQPTGRNQREEATDETRIKHRIFKSVFHLCRYSGGTTRICGSSAGSKGWLRKQAFAGLYYESQPRCQRAARRGACASARRRSADYTA
jgi:hypothetical protein